MIRRIKDYTKKSPSKDSHKIYVVCEGAGTEPAYFSFFNQCSSNLEVITIPPHDGTDPLKLIENAKRVFLADNSRYLVDYVHGDTVWFVFDTDLSEKEGKIAPLCQFCEAQNDIISEKYDEIKSYHAWNVAQSNPCFEIWLFYHFFNEAPVNYSKSQHGTFKAYVNEQISGGFQFQVHPVFLEDAIANASANYHASNHYKLQLYSTEMFKLGTEILSFTKKELDKLKNKLG